MAGREVKIPKKVESVAHLYSVTGYILALNKADKLSAFPPLNEFFRMAYPAFKNIGSVGRGGQVDMEALAKLNPDLFICRATDAKNLSAVTELGIPAIGVSIETSEEIATMLTLLGKVLDAEDRAGELIAYYDTVLDRVRNISGDVPPEKRKTAVFMGQRIASVANGSMLQSLMIETAGGVNPAKDVISAETWPVVGAETIFKWDPDIIFITNYGNAGYTVESLTSDTTWANMSAVKERRVYLMPASMDSWEFPGTSWVLGSLWMLSVMYPDKLDWEQLDSQVREFYKKVYNLDVTPELIGY